MKLSKNMRNYMGRAAAAVLCAAMVLPMLPAIPAYAAGQPEMHVHTQECFEQSRGALKCSKTHEHTDSCYETAYGDVACGLEGLPADLIPLAGSVTDADNALDWRASLDGETDPVKRAAIAAAGMPGEVSGSDIDTVNSVLDAAGIPGSQLARYDTVEAWDKAYKHTQLNRNDNGKTGLPKAGDIVFFNDAKDGTQAATRMGVAASVNSQDKSVAVTASNGSSAETVHIGTAQACWYLDMAAACLGMTGTGGNGQNGVQDGNEGGADAQAPGQDGTPGNADNNDGDNHGQANGEDGEFRCRLGLVEHVHGKSCYENTAGGEAGALTCGKQEHVHTADCLEGAEVRTNGDKVVYRDGKIYKVTYDDDGNEILTEITGADVRSNGDVYDADGNFVGNLFDTDGDGILSKEELEAASEIFDKLIGKIEEVAPAAKVAAKMMRAVMMDGLGQYSIPELITKETAFRGYATTSIPYREERQEPEKIYRLADTSKFINMNLYDYYDAPANKEGESFLRFGFVSGPEYGKMIKPDVWSGLTFGDYIQADAGGGGADGGNSAINSVKKSGNDNIPLGIGFGNLQKAPIYDFLEDNRPAIGDMAVLKSIKYLFPRADELDERYVFTNRVRKMNKENASGLFMREENTNHYMFDSSVTHAQWSEEKDAFELYDAIITPNMSPYAYGNFLPLNKINHGYATCVADISKKYNNVCSGAYMRFYTYMDYVIDKFERAYAMGDYFGDIGAKLYQNSRNAIIARFEDARDVYFNPAGYDKLDSSVKSYLQELNLAKNMTEWRALSPYERMNAVAYAANYFGSGGSGKVPNPVLGDVDRMYNIDYDVPTNFHFGMDMTLLFMQSADGIDNGRNLEFAFTGDDDVLVYIDGMKYLDLSGIHNAVSGEIDFSRGVVRYYTTFGTGVWLPLSGSSHYAQSDVNGNIVQSFDRASGGTYMHNSRKPSAILTFETILNSVGYTQKSDPIYVSGPVVGNVEYAGEVVVKFTNPITNDVIEMQEILLHDDNGNVVCDSKNEPVKSYRFRDFSEHSLNFYFLERGAGSSLCQIDFTLPLLNSHDLTISKEVATDDDENGETLLGNPDFLFQVYTWPKDTEYSECVNSKDSATLLTGVAYDIVDADGNKLNAEPLYINDDGIIPIKKGQSIVIERREDAGYYFVRELLDEQTYQEYGTIVNNVEMSLDLDGIGTMNGKMYHTRDTAILNFKADSTRVKFINKLQREAGTVEIQKTTNLGDDDGSYDFEVLLDGGQLPVGTEYELMPIQDDAGTANHPEQSGGTPDGGETSDPNTVTGGGQETEEPGTVPDTQGGGTGGADSGIRTVTAAGIVSVPNGYKAVIRNVLYGTKVEIKETGESQEGFRPMYELYVDGEKKSDGTADNGYVTWTLLRNPDAMAEGTDGMHVVLKCRNVRDGDLPNAGGAGTTAFLLTGLTAMGAAALGLAMMKKKRR